MFEKPDYFVQVRVNLWKSAKSRRRAGIKRVHFVSSISAATPSERTLLLGPNHAACQEGNYDGGNGGLYLLKNETKKIKTQGEWCRKVGFSLVVLRSSQSRQCLDGMSVKSALLLVTSQVLSLHNTQGSFHILNPGRWLSSLLP